MYSSSHLRAYLSTLLGVTVVYPSTLALLLALGPYVTDKGQLVLWQDQGTQLFGFQKKGDLQDVFAIRLSTLLINLGVELYTSNTAQRKAVDIWLRAVDAAVSLPNGDYYYNLLIGQASSRLDLIGDSAITLTASRNRGLVLGLSGDSSMLADATVTP